MMKFSVQSRVTPLTRGRFEEEPGWDGGNKNNNNSNFQEHTQIPKLYMCSTPGC